MPQKTSELELPLKVIGPDGTVLWQGFGQFGAVLQVKNTATSGTIGQWNHCILDTTATTGAFLPADNVAATVALTPLVWGVNQGSTTPSSTMGFAMQPIPFGQSGLTAGVGSICFASTASSTGTIGRFVIGAASGNVTDTVTIPTVPTIAPGRTVKPSGTTTGAQFGITDTGTASRMVVLVSPISQT